MHDFSFPPVRDFESRARSFEAVGRVTRVDPLEASRAER